MKLNKFLILPLAASIGFSSTAILAGGNLDRRVDIDYISTEVRPEIVGLMSTVSGSVTGIHEYSNDTETFYYVNILSNDSKNYVFFIEDNTVFIKDGELVSIDSIKKGMELTVHFKDTSGVISGPLFLNLNESNLKALEQDLNIVNNLQEGTHIFTASAVIISTEEHPVTVHVDIFDKYLISSDFKLRLTIDEDTLIVDTNNKKYEGTLENKKLAVVYYVSTRSLPAIPMQPKIIVLGDAEINNFCLSGQ